MATRRRSNPPAFDRVTQDAPTREWTVLAQDPSVRGPGGRALTTRVTVPAERLEAGPKGHRVHVIDYDATRRAYYEPRKQALTSDPFERVSDIDRLVGDPHFHQQNVYAIAMATLGHFQRALGRPVPWGFDFPSHQLKIAPHAFADANAYYSRESESLCFGYFAGVSGRTVFTCLSHDIVAHETSHALLDGLRRYYLRPSHVDQAAFHEGFADLIALLSVLQSPEWVELGLGDIADRRHLIPSARLRYAVLKDNVLLKLAKEFGREEAGVRGDALRHSIELKPSVAILDRPEFQESHRRGEVLVAAVTQAFLRIWCQRLTVLGTRYRQAINKTVVADEAATAARHLLRIVIRALDYLPPVDLTFGDYLSALLTADMQLYPDDGRYDYRRKLRESFEAFGIRPASATRGDGAWDPPPAEVALDYDGLYFETLQRDPNTLFRFLWENRVALDLDRDAFTRVTAVHPTTRVSEDGIVLRETIVEYMQTLKAYARELPSLGLRCPAGLSGQTFVTLYGGGTLVFDDFGRLKFHIGTGVRSESQNARLQSLYDQGAFNRDAVEHTRFGALHQRRMLGSITHPEEQW